MDLEFCHVINRAHSVVNFLLALVSDWAVYGVIIAASHTIVVTHIRIIELLIQNTTEGHAWVKLDPRRSKHEVDVAFELVSPELDDTA